MKNLVFTSAVIASCVAFADADVLNRPAGIKIGERLTLSPYVCMSYTYDNNSDAEKDGSGTSYFSINPGIGIDYAAENWRVAGSVYYQYHASLSGRSDSLNNSSYGEQLGFSWSSNKGGAGWSAMITECFSVINQNDDLAYSDGKGLWRDRTQFTVNAVLNRRFTDKFHASVNGSFYWLDYANDVKAYAPLYGWDRWSAGAQIGYTFSPWTDVFLSGSYQGYGQDNAGDPWKTQTDGRSSGWTAHLGVGSHLTERISYRLSGGVSTFEYGGNSRNSSFTYNGSLNWKFAETWSTSLLLASYYQPSEREYCAASRNDSISWGLTKSLIRGKMSATLDLAYRRDTRVENNELYSSDWDLNIITARLGLNYQFNRLVSVFGRAEYQTELNSGNEVGSHYDYDRWRLTVGMKLSY